MKNFISLFVVAAAAMMISCGGNANQTATEVVDSVAIVETVCCDSVACDSVACDSVACESAATCAKK